MNVRSAPLVGDVRGVKVGSVEGGGRSWVMDFRVGAVEGGLVG